MTGPPSPPDLLRHAAFVRAVARAALRGDDLVDDVVQETWVAALEGGAARATRLRPWLGGVARRQAANLLRRRIATRERERRIARPESQASTTADGADVADRAEMGRALVGAVLGLEEPYRTAVLLRYYDDLPPREIAKRTGVPVETARTHVKRGLQRLRRLLDEDARRHGRSAPVLLLPLLDGGRRSLGSVLPLVGGLLAVKKLLLALGVLLGVVLGAYAVRHHSLPGSAPTGTPPVDVAAAPAPPRLEGTADGDAASTTATAAADAPSREHVAAETTSFRGVVVDPEGNPIPGVTVEIDRYPAMHFSQHGGADVVDPDDVAPVTSDDAGRFRLEVPGSVGFVQARTRAEDWVATAPFGLGLSSQSETRIVMAPAYPLDVTLLDEATGGPIQGAEIRGLVGVMARAYLVHPPRPTVVARTDTHGRARLGLPEGRVRLLAIAEGYATCLEDGIGLRPEGGSITLRLRPGGVVRGLVVDPEGAPVEGAYVHAFAPAAWQAWATTDAAGAFLLKNTTPPLTGGPEAMARTHVVVHVRAQDHPRAWGAIRAPGPGEEVALRVVLERARRLTGRVRMADGTEPPSGRVLLTLMDLGTREHYASTPTVHGHIDASGKFAFADLPAGPLELLLYLGTSWEKTVTVEIPVEGEPEVVDVVLGDGVALKVRALDAAGDPVPGARVYAVREDLESPYGDPSFGIGPVTGEDGRAVLKNAASVPTWVVVDAPGYGMEVRLVDPATAPAELDVRLGDGVIEGVALHPDGRPARVQVRLTRRIRLARHSTSIPSRATRVETDVEGRFRFEGVGGGDYGIDVEGGEARLLSFGVRLHAGDMDTRLVVATTAEASKLHVEALLLDAETSEPLESDDGLYVSIHPEGGRGSAMMERLSEPAGVYRSTEAHAPGTHTVRVRGKGWGSAEAVVTLRWGAETPRPRIHLARSD